MQSRVLLIAAHCIDYIKQGQNDYSTNPINSSHYAFTQDLITACLMYLMVRRPAVQKSMYVKVLVLMTYVTRDSSVVLEPAAMPRKWNPNRKLSRAAIILNT